MSKPHYSVHQGFLAAGILSLILPFLACKSASPSLEEDILAEMRRSDGLFAVAYQDLEDSTRQLWINADSLFHAASTMKTPVLFELYKQAGEGKRNLQDSLTIKNEFYSIVDSSVYGLSAADDSDSTLYQRIGQKETIYNLAYLMIIRSSNLATNLLIELVSGPAVTATMRRLGARDMQVLRGVEDSKAYRAGRNNVTTARDLLTLFKALDQHILVDREACNAMIEVLTHQEFKDGIPAKLPPDVTVAHKTGWISSARHDSGIVYLPDGRKYVLVLLSKNWTSDSLAAEVQANISARIYQDYQPKSTK